MDVGIYGGILDMIQITDKKLLHFKLSKSGQILHVDKTCFPRPSHIFYTITVQLNTVESIHAYIAHNENAVVWVSYLQSKRDSLNIMT